MPLPDSGPREELHHRRIDLRGYRRADGLYDIEARMNDAKATEVVVGGGRKVPVGGFVHDMWIRLVVDEDMLVVDVAAVSDATPYDICPEATGALQTIKGLRIGAGWTRAVRERLSGRKGCTHLTELLQPLATVALQTLWEVRKSRPQALDGTGKPRKIDSCYAYASDREVVHKLWPMHYDGPPTT